MKLYKLIEAMAVEEDVLISGMQTKDDKLETYYSGKREDVPIGLAGYEVIYVTGRGLSKVEIVIDDEEE